MSIRFATIRQNFSDRQRLEFQVPTDGRFHEVDLPLSDLPSWRGSVRKLQLRLPSASGAVEVDYIRFVANAGEKGN